MDFTFADFYLILTVVFAAAATFMTYESRAREEKYSEFLSMGLIALVYALPLTTAPVMNETYFHFSGIVGNIVAAALVIAIFVEPVRRGTDYACRHWLHKDVLAMVENKG